VSGLRSRRKGKVGEREVANLLNEALGYEAFKRNIMQSRQGGCDLDTELPVAIEVKRQQKLQVGAAVKQARQQGRDINKTPVLMYRANHEDWFVLVDMSVAELVEYIKWRVTPTAGSAPRTDVSTDQTARSAS
jgi:Holliday junction resolvase-like predicted endonuclease